MNKLQNRKQLDLDSKANNNRKSAADRLNAMIDGSDIRKINCKNIAEWKYANRTQYELGNINELSESIKNHTQLQAGLVVPKSDIFQPLEDNDEIEYIIIAGRRRYLACANIDEDYTARVIFNLTIEEALEIQRVENKEREDITDHSEGMSYFNAVNNGDTTVKKLIERTNQSQTTVYRYMYFGKLKNDYTQLYNAIGDFSKVSYKSAEEIYSFCKKGYAKDLISHVNELKKGIGRRKIQNLISNKNTESKDWLSDNNIKLLTTLTNNKLKLYPENLNISLDEASKLIYNQLKKHVIDSPRGEL